MPCEMSGPTDFEAHYEGSVDGDFEELQRQLCKTFKRMPPKRGFWKDWWAFHQARDVANKLLDNATYLRGPQLEMSEFEKQYEAARRLSGKLHAKAFGYKGKYARS